MYFIAGKDKNNQYYLEEILDDWHMAVDSFEPIDCIKGEMVIYDESGHKYLVGPEKDLKEDKIFGKVVGVDVGSWDFDKGEPFLLDTNEVVPEELRLILVEYAIRDKLERSAAESMKLEELIRAVQE